MINPFEEIRKLAQKSTSDLQKQAARTTAALTSHEAVMKKLRQLTEEIAKLDTQKAITASSTPLAKPGPSHGPSCNCASCISFFGHPGSGRLWAAPPTPEPEEMETDDIEVARYGLRTFNTQAGVLGSVAITGCHWEDGVIEAKCMKGDTIRMAMWGDEEQLVPITHKAPHKHCSCGAYATVTLQSLVSQYAAKAQYNIAVVAAEGPTIIGSRGMRTSAARVVAYWTPDTREGKFAKAVYERVCGSEVPHYTDVREMLKAFNFEKYEHPLPWERRDVVMYPDGLVRLRTGMVSYTPSYSPPPPTPPAPKPMSQQSWDKLRKVMGPNATQAGIDAVRKLNNYTYPSRAIEKKKDE